MLEHCIQSSLRIVAHRIIWRYAVGVILIMRNRLSSMHLFKPLKHIQHKPQHIYTICSNLYPFIHTSVAHGMVLKRKRSWTYIVYVERKLWASNVCLCVRDGRLSSTNWQSYIVFSIAAEINLFRMNGMICSNRRPRPTSTRSHVVGAPINLLSISWCCLKLRQSIHGMFIHRQLSGIL